ncbi:MAG TPA: hypothetical protein VNN25_15490, partial [Thermoanaerobaculia bacterium]|nr:hypothetical protein [Thermoanaerobaculia bacterium]
FIRRAVAFDRRAVAFVRRAVAFYRRAVAFIRHDVAFARVLSRLSAGNRVYRPEIVFIGRAVAFFG